MISTGNTTHNDDDIYDDDDDRDNDDDGDGDDESVVSAVAPSYSWAQFECDYMIQLGYGAQRFSCAAELCLS